MPLASTDIVLPAPGALASVSFLATAVLPHGDPLAGANLEFRIDGAGSFDPTEMVQEATRAADMNGEVFFTWYSLADPTSTDELHSRLSVFCDFAECLVMLERQD